MRDPREVRVAVVRKAGVPAATITRTRAGNEFCYLPDYAGRPVARTLPLDAPPLLSVAGAVPPFFAGLLPEGRRLTALRRAIKTSADDDLSLLLAVGTSTIGDVTVTAEGDDLVAPEPLLTGGDLDFGQLLQATGLIDRVGLPGVQEKASGAMISLPVSLGGVAAIVKLDPPEYPGVVTNEAYFLKLARRLPIPVANAELVDDIHGRPGLVVERFDRVQVAGAVRSLAVEDACQLLGNYPADKYTATSEEVGQAIASACPATAVAARACLLQFSFAWLCGNGDLHAKNLSVLQSPDGEWRVAPMYDIPSTLPYGDHTMALSLAGRRQGLGRKAFLTYGATLGLPPKAVERALGDALAATEPLLDDIASGALRLNPNQTKTLIRQLARRRRDVTTP